MSLKTIHDRLRAATVPHLCPGDPGAAKRFPDDYDDPGIGAWTCQVCKGFRNKYKGGTPGEVTKPHRSVLPYDEKQALADLHLLWVVARLATRVGLTHEPATRELQDALNAVEDAP